MSTQVILYSGGMDSFILAHLFPEAQLLYVDVGSKYSAKELIYLQRPDSRDVTVDTSISLGSWERADAIIPGRNAFLALVASQYGDDIMLGATAGDQSRDKDDKWAAMMGQLLAYMYSGKHFQPPRDMRVLLPIKDMTKAELVARYLQRGGKHRALLNTVSCYSPHHFQCGRCKSCLRKWVALEANNIVSANIWASDPRDPKNWEEIIPRLTGPGWRTPQEDDETRGVLRSHGLLGAAQ